MHQAFGSDHKLTDQVRPSHAVGQLTIAAPPRSQRCLTSRSKPRCSPLPAFWSTTEPLRMLPRSLGLSLVTGSRTTRASVDSRLRILQHREATALDLPEVGGHARLAGDIPDRAQGPALGLLRPLILVAMLHEGRRDTLAVGIDRGLVQSVLGQTGATRTVTHGGTTGSCKRVRTVFDDESRKPGE